MTPRQLHQIKNKHHKQDPIFLLAVMYLQKNLNDEEFKNALPRYLDETFSPIPSASEIVNELKLIIKKFTSAILPTIKHLSFIKLANSDAVSLSAKLTAHSALALIMSEEEFAFADDPTLQAPSQLVARFFDANNNTDPQHLLLILNNLFDNYPELKNSSAFNDLMLQVELAIDNNSNIGADYLSDALAEFNAWKKGHKLYIGILRKILILADLLAKKYPTAKKEVLELCFAMFRDMLNDRDLLPTYYAKVFDIIMTLIIINDKQITHSLGRHAANNKAFDSWILIEITDHPVFCKLTISEKRVIFGLITTSLNNDIAFSKSELRYILDRCENPTARIILLQSITALYDRAPYPRLATLIEWIKPIADNDTKQLSTVMSDQFIKFKSTANLVTNPDSIILEKQLNKLRRDVDVYAHTSCIHTRKTRAAYLNMLSIRQLTFIDTKTPAEKQSLLQQTIVELYLHYSTIEDASGILSRSLEKRLLKLLQIPQDETLIKAKTQRDNFLYKLQNFFCAGRSFFKRYHDKTNDPVHAIIKQHLSLSPAISTQINQLQNEARALDELDRMETSLFHRSAITEERLVEIGENIAISL